MVAMGLTPPFCTHFSGPPGRGGPENVGFRPRDRHGRARHTLLCPRSWRELRRPKSRPRETKFWTFGIWNQSNQSNRSRKHANRSKIYLLGGRLLAAFRRSSQDSFESDSDSNESQEVQQKSLTSGAFKLWIFWNTESIDQCIDPIDRRPPC